MQGPKASQVIGESEVILNPRVSIQSVEKLKLHVRRGRNKSFFSMEDEKEELKKQDFAAQINGKNLE